jgi:hypothetical protein
LSPDFKQEHESSEVYTPSFDHKTGIEFRKQSPLSLINQLKDVSAQKTAEPPYLRKRRNKFKQRFDETPYIGHIMINNDGQQVLQPLYPTNLARGASLPPPVPLGKAYLHENENEEEEKEEVAPTHYYPTCHCQQYYSNMYYNPHGYYYAPANLYFSPGSDDSERTMNKRNRKHRRKSK